MQRYVVAAVAALLVLGAAAVARRGVPPPPPAPAPKAAEPPPPAYLTGPLEEVPHRGLPVERVQALAKKLEPLQARMPPSTDDDWLHFNIEPGQTFRQYVRSDPNRPTAERGVIYVAQAGAFTEAQRPLLEGATEALGLFFGLPLKSLPALDLGGLPAEALRAEGRGFGEQVLTDAVLDLLRARRPADAVAVIALTPHDLWPGEGWNFVFGQASLEDRVGVWSVARLAPAGTAPALAMRRTVQVALHETGHMLGIHHCIFWACGMNGSNSLEESDRAPVAFCVEDEMKLWWACPVEPAGRAAALAAFARRRGLDAEARSWAASAEALSR